jgi:hypothetical protein
MGSFVSDDGAWFGDRLKPAPLCTMKCLRLYLIGLLVLTVRTAYAIDPGTAEGSLTRAGEITALTHASAFRFDDRARLAQHTDSAPALRVLLTSGPVNEQLLREVDTRALARDTQRTRLPAVLLELPPNATGDSKASLLVLPAPPGIPLYTVYADAEVTLMRNATRVTGTVKFQAPRENLGVVAHFSAPLFSEELPLENLSGEPAQSSAPAIALLDFEERLKARDFGAARRLVTPEMLPQIIDLERRAADLEFATHFAARLPERALRRRQISQVAIYRDVAYVVVNGRASSLTTLRATEGQWRIDE